MQTLLFADIMEEDNTNTLLAELENFHISTKSPAKENIKVYSDLLDNCCPYENLKYIFENSSDLNFDFKGA